MKIELRWPWRILTIRAWELEVVMVIGLWKTADREGFRVELRYGHGPFEGGEGGYAVTARKRKGKTKSRMATSDMRASNLPR